MMNATHVVPPYFGDVRFECGFHVVDRGRRIPVRDGDLLAGAVEGEAANRQTTRARGRVPSPAPHPSGGWTAASSSIGHTLGEPGAVRRETDLCFPILPGR